MRQTFRATFFSTVIIFSFFFLYSYASAQLTVGGVLPAYVKGNIEMISNPAYPTPNSKVDITIDSHNVDLDSSEITWLVNEKVVSKAVGLKTINVTLGNTGTTTEIKALIKSTAGDIISKTLSINPTQIDLLWETDGYVPPLYKGLSHYTYQGTVYVVAQPYFKTKSGKVLNPKDLVYTWKKDSNVLGDDSGRGKQRLSLPGDVLQKSAFITVTVVSPENEMVGQMGINLEPEDPQVVFYEKNPLFGTLWNKAITSPYTMTNNEIEVLATPYNFTKKDVLTSKMNYIWLIGGTEYPELAGKNSVVLRPKSGVSGASTIYSEVTTPLHILQKAENSSVINFSITNENSN
ncbi:MAG: hypothetical protein NTV72_00280 [Candidatus Taylorbacteria bacterium]|nr:hypothetical protein [Candidatus Taylorbacteria bacterium]